MNWRYVAELSKQEFPHQADNGRGIIVHYKKQQKNQQRPV